MFKRKDTQLIVEGWRDFINERGNVDLNKFIKKSGDSPLPTYLFFCNPIEWNEKYSIYKEYKNKFGELKGTEPRFLYFDKNLENFETILELFGRYISDNDKPLLKSSINKDFPIFIVNKHGDFNKRSGNEVVDNSNDNIAWAIHDLFHVLEFKHETLSKFSGMNALHLFSSPENDDVWSEEIIGINEEGDIINIDLFNSSKETFESIEDFFNNIGYASGGDTEDLYPTIWAYVCTHINSESDIDSLPLSDHAKNAFRFYLKRKNLFIKFLKSPGIKSKIFIGIWD